MAKPQVEDGYTRIANELLEAVISYPFSKRQLSVLLAVFRQTYGFNRKDAELSLGTLSARTKIDKANVSRTLSELEGLGVLTKRSAPTGAVIGINKDYERWGCQIGNVAKTATEGLPKQQPEGCQNSNPYKDSFKDKGKTDVFITPERVITFDDFWTPYPNKVSKAAAMKAWGKLKATPELADEILAALESQKAWRAAMQAAGEWVPEWPHGATWLNGSRWEDELPATKNLTNAGPKRPSGGFDEASGKPRKLSLGERATEHRKRFEQQAATVEREIDGQLVGADEPPLRAQVV